MTVREEDRFPRASSRACLNRNAYARCERMQMNGPQLAVIVPRRNE